MASKLSHESLTLRGILAGLSAPVYKELFIKDFTARQELLSAIRAHESSNVTLKLLDSLHRITIPQRSETIHTLLKEVTNISGFIEKATTPLLYTNVHSLIKTFY